MLQGENRSQRQPADTTLCAATKPLTRDCRCSVLCPSCHRGGSADPPAKASPSFLLSPPAHHCTVLLSYISNSSLHTTRPHQNSDQRHSLKTARCELSPAWTSDPSPLPPSPLHGQTSGQSCLLSLEPLISSLLLHPHRPEAAPHKAVVTTVWMNAAGPRQCSAPPASRQH